MVHLQTVDGNAVSKLFHMAEDTAHARNTFPGMLSVVVLAALAGVYIYLKVPHGLSKNEGHAWFSLAEFERKCSA